MNEQQLTELATAALDDLKAADVQVLDVTKLTTITDRMVFASGRSARHVKALSDNLVKQAKAAGVSPRGIEGAEQAEWILVDLGAVVVHLMQPQTRAFYQLEKLWQAEAGAVNANNA